MYQVETIKERSVCSLLLMCLCTFNPTLCFEHLLVWYEIKSLSLHLIIIITKKMLPMHLHDVDAFTSLTVPLLVCLKPSPHARREHNTAKSLWHWCFAAICLPNLQKKPRSTGSSMKRWWPRPRREVRSFYKAIHVHVTSTASETLGSTALQQRQSCHFSSWLGATSCV